MYRWGYYNKEKLLFTLGEKPEFSSPPPFPTARIQIPWTPVIIIWLGKKVCLKE